MPQWSDLNLEGLPTKDDFERFLGLSGFACPDHLREFLMVVNGGCPSPSGYTVTLHDGIIQERHLDCMLPLHSNFWDGERTDARQRQPMLDILMEVLDAFPLTPMVPFAIDTTGGVLAIRLDGLDTGHIVLLTQDGEEPLFVANDLTCFFEEVH